MFPSFERVNISCRQKIVIQFKRPPCHNKTGFEQSLSCGVDPCFGSGPAVIAAAHVQKNIKKHQYIVRGVYDRARVAISFEDVQKCRDTMKNKGCVLSIVVLWRCNARKRKIISYRHFPVAGEMHVPIPTHRSTGPTLPCRTEGLRRTFLPGRKSVLSD